MPRYYCDYCDTYLTHDSPVVRKQHNTGYKHKANVRNYYMQFEEAQTQELIDSKIMEHLAKAGAGDPMMGGPMGPMGPMGMGMRPPGMMGYPPHGVPGMPNRGPGPGMPLLHGSQPPHSMPYRPPAGMPPPGGPYRPQSMPPPQYAAYPPRQ